MNKQSNTYTIIYISALVCIVGAVLAWVALALKPKQSDNIRIDKMQQMLSSIRITSTTDNAIDLYNKYVVDSYIVNDNGEKLSGEAFDISVASEIKKLKTSGNCLCLSATSTIRSNISFLYMVLVYGVRYGDISQSSLTAAQSMALISLIRERPLAWAQKLPNRHLPTNSMANICIKAGSSSLSL